MVNTWLFESGLSIGEAPYRLAFFGLSESANSHSRTLASAALARPAAHGFPWSSRSEKWRQLTSTASLNVCEEKDSTA
jgi:hypothetical protein